MRHAMGAHNTYAGMGSIVSEDAEINDCGKAQAEAVKRCLQEAGVLKSLHLAVVSPFKRTLQTALHVLREDRAHGPGSEVSKALAVPTIVHPLCAEQTFVHSHVSRGNRGSTVEELSCFPEFGVFDWKEVEEYCKHRRVHDGKWWHHGPHSEETERSFRRRAVQLKKWLGRLQDHRSAPKVLMVCHGGIMQAAFDYQPHPPNCAFRVYDVDRSGRARHVAAEAWVASESLADPAFQVLSVVRLNEKVDGVTMFRVEIAVGQEEFYSDISENVLRDNLHDPVKEALPSELYDQFSLGGLFPSWWSWLNRARTDLSIYIQDYLEQLSVAMADVAFPKPCAKLVDELLLQGRLQIQEELPQEHQDSCRVS
ncbi:unnamed protein product [Effrenium voratum]|nr:unnamed protein product [Effrenium voratum]